ncbi:MAG: protein-glutamate O-methyltransferase CheR [Polyangiaceae bacterium]
MTMQEDGGLDPQSYERIRKLVHERSGIALGPSKATLVSARLGGRLRKLGLDGFKSYIRHLEADASGEELTELLDAISTNVTSFFREPDHFEVTRKLVTRWRDAGQSRFRFWSAACSTGEEPYSLSMAVDDLVQNLDARILATDISTDALRRAMRGVYPERALATVPGDLRARHAKRRPGGDDFEVTASIKKRIVFRQLNLSKQPLPLHGPLDIIFCRNVMIYFEEPLRRALVGEFHRLLKPGGLLLIGHSESIVGDHPFKTLQPATYQKEG